MHTNEPDPRSYWQDKTMQGYVVNRQPKPSWTEVFRFALSEKRTKNAGGIDRNGVILGPYTRVKFKVRWLLVICKEVKAVNSHMQKSCGNWPAIIQSFIPITSVAGATCPVCKYRRFFICFLPNKCGRCLRVFVE